MVRRATRCGVIPGMDKFVQTHPTLQARVDNSLYFVKFDLHEPADGSSRLKLGNWVELQSAIDNANGVEPARSTNNYDAGLFNSKLVPSADCTSNMRVAVIDFGGWPIKTVVNFKGKLSVGQKMIKILNLNFDLCPFWL